MKRVCPVSGKEFTITEKDLKFYEKMGVPVPNLCPEERQRRRIAYRNFRNLYRRKCDATGKQLISMYHENQPFPVYENEYWWGDSWDAKSFGKAFDFSRSFFEQYAELSQKVPHFSIFNIQCENTEYSNFSWLSKNSYLVFGCVRDEDCLYGHIVWDSKDCIDNLYVFRCEWCSGCVDCIDCYDLHFSTESTNCNESYFLHDCRGCSNCFACTNLRNKQYYFLNQKYTKEKYFQKLKEIQPFSSQTLENGKIWLEKLKQESCIFPPLFGVKNEDISGNHLYECKNCQQSFDAQKGEDSKFLYTSYEQINSYDISFTGIQTNYCLESLTIHAAENCAFCHSVNNSHDVMYSEFCFDSHDLFGCHGLRRAQYCIFNKQYSKEEYFVLRDKIIDHMKKIGEFGEFFPMINSPFAYNESIVNEYFPLTKEQALEKGYKWKDEERTMKYEGLIYKIPNNISDVTDDVCKQILQCECCSKHYRIQKAELNFYRKMNLPIPRKCPDCRHLDRMRLRNPRKLWTRKCDKCSVEIQTTFAPERPEKVYCEKCYLEEVN